MFEEEAEKHKEEFIDIYINVGGGLKAADMIGTQKELSYKEGAEFGYNKAFMEMSKHIAKLEKENAELKSEFSALKTNDY